MHNVITLVRNVGLILLAIIAGLTIAMTIEVVRESFQPPAATYMVGDDNNDFVIDEDESGWDCQRMGNGFCGL